jgi:hypothetical protein
MSVDLTYLLTKVGLGQTSLNVTPVQGFPATSPVKAVPNLLGGIEETSDWIALAGAPHSDTGLGSSSQTAHRSY